jgi:hypothetical protein
MPDTMHGGSREEALKNAQLERALLDNEKLKLDLAGMRSTKPWYQSLAPIIPVITTTLAVTGFLWGIFQYVAQQRANRIAQERQSDREQETAEREFMKPWLESQRSIYAGALSAAATAANSEDPADRKKAVIEFWQLYQGKMILVETKSVSGKMVLFGDCLDGTATCDRSEMNKRCRALATAMAESMAATAKMTFKEFAANQFQYRSGP